MIPSFFKSTFALLLSKTNDSLEKIRCFDSYSLIFPFLCPKANRSHRSSLRRSFLKIDRSYSPSSLFTKKTVSELLPLLITKEWTWAIRSRRSLQKIYMSNFLFFESKLLFRSQKWFAQKKRRANSYPACAQAESQQNFFLFFFILKQTELGLGGHSYLNVCVAAPLYELLKN